MSDYPSDCSSIDMSDYEPEQRVKVKVNRMEGGDINFVFVFTGQKNEPDIISSIGSILNEIMPRVKDQTEDKLRNVEEGNQRVQEFHNLYAGRLQRSKSLTDVYSPESGNHQSLSRFHRLRQSCNDGRKMKSFMTCNAEVTAEGNVTELEVTQYKRKSIQNHAFKKQGSDSRFKNYFSLLRVAVTTLSLVLAVALIYTLIVYTKVWQRNV